MAKRPIPNTSWGGGCGDKKIMLLVAWSVTRWREVVRYVRTGQEP